MNLPEVVQHGRSLAADGEVWLEVTHHGMEVLRAMGRAYDPRSLTTGFPGLPVGLEIRIVLSEQYGWEPLDWRLMCRQPLMSPQLVMRGTFGLEVKQ